MPVFCVVGGSISVFSWVVWTNFAQILAFVVFLSAALLLRRRPEFHKRSIQLASITLIAPALGHISLWPVFGWIESEIPFVTTVWLVLLVPLGVHDLIVNNRLHKVQLLEGPISS